MSRHASVPCVILAGGQGTRMASSQHHKVCFPVHGKPAIVRAIDTYKAAGLSRFVVVVGQMAEEVVSTVAAEHPEVSFVYQASPQGTGHAAQVAIRALRCQGYRGPVMVVMGDKVTWKGTVEGLLTRLHETGADMVVTALPKTERTRAGRLVTDDDGRVLGSVELPDIQRAIEQKKRVTVDGRRLSPKTIETQSTHVNGSMYVADFDTLHDALTRLKPDNAQHELYLTDTVSHVVEAGGRVELFELTNPDDLMAFNTPAELMRIEHVVARRDQPSRVARAPRVQPPKTKCKPASRWLTMLEKNTAAVKKRLADLYGDDPSLVDARRRAMIEVVRAFGDTYGGDREMILCRAPGRINLMGRHVDHRGGFVNVMAISREVLLAASRREDDVVHLENLQADRFPSREFRITELLGDQSWSDWMDFVDSGTVRKHLDYSPGDWSHYARAPVLRLQYESRSRMLRGFDCMVSGNIPTGAGLSSSSAMVVAFAEAAIALNGLDVAMRDFIDMCGEGEWFVGSRGGAADHAAIRTSKRGYLSRIGFFPFRLDGQVHFPEGLKVVVAHSGTQAVKSASARDVFNQRVACYNLAEFFLKRLWPAAAGIEHLRDLDPERLKLAEADLFGAVRLLPDRPSRNQLSQMTPGEDLPRLEKMLSTHADIGRYDLRGVAMFGITECRRSSRFKDLVEAGDLEAVGRAMTISHDGDRVSRHVPGDGVAPFEVDLSDKALEELATSGAGLIDHPGRYACSTEDIDRLVDLATGVPGVVGAQLAGAGLGGCMMILARDESMDTLLSTLSEQYYQDKQLDPQEHLHVILPVEGAGLVGF